MMTPLMDWRCCPRGGPMSTTPPARTSLTIAATSLHAPQRKLTPPLAVCSPYWPTVWAGRSLGVRRTSCSAIPPPYQDTHLIYTRYSNASADDWESVRAQAPATHVLVTTADGATPRRGGRSRRVR